MLVFTIKQIRESKKISLSKLSRETGISRPYLFDLENNRRFNPTMQMLYKISSTLGVNIKDLFFTTLDIDDLRKEMYTRIDKYGFGSDKVMEISHILDLLINLKYVEK